LAGGSEALWPESDGRRNLLSSDLPRFLVDLRDPKLEQTAKFIGWEESPQLMYRRGGFSCS
jgi:hypothetical protein